MARAGKLLLIRHASEWVLQTGRHPPGRTKRLSLGRSTVDMIFVVRRIHELA